MQSRLPFFDFEEELSPQGGSHRESTDPVASAFRRKDRNDAVQLSTGTELFDVHFVRMPRAKRYVLRVRNDGALRVTIPRGGSRAEALRFAERHLAWAARER